MKNSFFFLFFALKISTFCSAQTFNGIGGNIPDGGPQANFTINVSGITSGIIDTSFGLQSVCLNIAHNYVGDLNIRLLAPDGTAVDLSIGNGGSGNNYTNTCFNNTTNNSIVNGTAPFSGSYKPQGLLGTVNNGQNPNGAWKLLILDSSQPDVGTLLNWRIVFSSNPAVSQIFSSSDLPIVVINTNGQTILDEPKITAHMGIIDNGIGQRNNLSDPYNNYNNMIGIEYRGSTSQGFPQKPYGLETRDSAGNQLDTTLLGMPREHDWILYPPYNDKSFARNVLTYDLARKMGNYASRTKFCELVVNGQYRGIYVLMEKIKRDKYRIDIAELDSNDISGDDLTGGYVIKIDKLTGSGGAGWTSNYLAAAHPNNQGIYFQYEYPDEDDIVIQQKAYIESYVDSFEYALSAISLSDSINGYRHFIDVNSFVDFLIINEISRNVDGYRLSTYLFKNKDSKGGKLKAGPVWDFNIAYKNSNYCSGNSTTGWAYQFGNVCGTDPNQVSFWWEKFMLDPTFKNDLKCRWQELRSTLLSTAALNSFIDSIATLTTESRIRHYDLWPILGVYVWPNPNPIPTTYAGEITALKSYLNSRLTWLDSNMPGVCSLGATANLEGQTIFNVFPNPAKENILLETTASTKSLLQVQLLNVLGEILLEQPHQLNGNGYQQIKISIPENITQGIYLLKVSSEKSNYSQKVFIEK
jgi:subtilisin-like proprotein convertase family protein